MAKEISTPDGFINTNGITINELIGKKVILVDFWTYSCINCQRTTPYLNAWYEKYKDKGLVIIGVHSPEFGFEKKYDNVKNAVDRNGITYPVVLDNDFSTWRAYQNSYWPRKYLIDTEGYIRYDHIGEGGYEETEEKIKELLSEIGNEVSSIETTQEKKELFLPRTPELYTGYSFALPRGQNIGNQIGIQPESIINYVLPNEVDKNIIYLEGKWKSNPDNLQLTDQMGSIILKFTGSSVNIVAKNLENPVKVEVLINGKYIVKEKAGSDIQFEEDKSFIFVDKPQLYNLINSNYGNYDLTLNILNKDFTFNAFTSG